MRTKNIKERLIAVFANAAAMSADDEWVMIAPYGEHPSRDRKRVQSFQREQADAMVATFNSTWHKLGTLFRGVPIYHGHPDVAPKEFTDDRRLGKIAQLEAREDGLYGKPDFNSLGAENQSEGWWIYPSPAWLSPKTTARTVYPDELLSVGLVNAPNLEGSEPWANAADPDEESSSEETNDTTIMDKAKLCALLGLDPETATEEEIFAKLAEVKEAAEAKATAENNAQEAADKEADAKTKMEEANSAKAAAEEAATTARKAAAEVMVNAAVATGRVTEAEREVTINSLSADGVDLRAKGKELLEKEPELNTGSIDLGGKKVTISDAKARRTAIETEVNARMPDFGGDYTKAYLAVKGDPQFAPLFEAMKQPGRDED